MKWITDRNPKTSGLYGVLLNEDRWDPFIFTFAFWDGTGWKLSSQSDMNAVPYRPVRIWCKLEIGQD